VPTFGKPTFAILTKRKGALKSYEVRDRLLKVFFAESHFPKIYTKIILKTLLFMDIYGIRKIPFWGRKPQI
jgi:hypothetical protein